MLIQQQLSRLMLDRLTALGYDGLNQLISLGEDVEMDD
jgi:hypothetical protein